VALEKKLQAAEQARVLLTEELSQLRDELVQSQQRLAELQVVREAAESERAQLAHELVEAESTIIRLREVQEDAPASRHTRVLEARLSSMEHHLAGKQVPPLSQVSHLPLMLLSGTCIGAAQAEIARLASERTAMKLQLDRADAERRETNVLHTSAKSWGAINGSMDGMDDVEAGDGTAAYGMSTSARHLAWCVARCHQNQLRAGRGTTSVVLLIYRGLYIGHGVAEAEVEVAVVAIRNYLRTSSSNRGCLGRPVSSTDSGVH
jgi:hypothetical protein